MVGISLDLNSKTSAAAGGNSITFASNSSTSSQNCQQEFSKFSPFSIQVTVFPFPQLKISPCLCTKSAVYLYVIFFGLIKYEKKESIEELQQRSGTSSSTHKTLFYSFLPTEHEQEDGAETTLSLNGRTFETKSDGIDLSLKLWVGSHYYLIHTYIYICLEWKKIIRLCKLHLKFSGLKRAIFIQHMLTFVVDAIFILISSCFWFP